MRVMNASRNTDSSCHSKVKVCVFTGMSSSFGSSSIGKYLKRDSIVEIG